MKTNPKQGNMNIMRRCIQIMMCGILLVAMTIAQGLVPSDSLLLFNAKKDTVQLRKLVRERAGERVAAQAHNRLGYLALKRNKNKTAEGEYLQTYRQYLNTSEAIEAGMHLGIIKNNQRKYTESKRYLREYLSKNPQGPDAEWAQHYLVQVMYKSEDTEYDVEVRRHLNRKRTVTAGKDVFVRTQLVQGLSDKQHYDEALSEAKKVFQLHPETPDTTEIQYQIGELYLRLKKFKEAKDHFNKLMKRVPQGSRWAARAQCQLGMVYFNENDYASARVAMTSVQQKYPKVTHYVNVSKYVLAEMSFREALTSQDSAKKSDALKEIKQFIAQEPKERHTPRALMMLATLCREKGNYTEEIEAYDTIIQFDSTLIPWNSFTALRSKYVKDHRALVLRARLAKAQTIQINMHRLEDAIQEYNMILSASPNNEEAGYNKALCLKEVGRIEESKALLAEIVQMNGSYKTLASDLLKTIENGR